MKKIFTLVYCLLLLCLGRPGIAAVKYVMQGGTGNGATWATAGDLQSVLTATVSGDIIWAKQGTYYASATGDSTASFYLKNNVAIYGGFVGTETLLSQRADTTGKLTILSGVLNNGAYSGHIVYGTAGLDSTAILNGFTISGAILNVNAVLGGGAGMYNEGSPLLCNIIFSNNVLNINELLSSDEVGGGGGMCNINGSPQLINVAFYNNAVNATSSTSPGGYTGGGGMYIYGGNVRMSNMTFVGNTVNIAGSSIVGGGGILVTGGISTNLHITNALFVKNMGNPNNAALGSGIYQSIANSIITNATFAENSSYPIYADLGTMTIQNSIVDNAFYNDYATLTVNNSFLGGNGAVGMTPYTGANNVLSPYAAPGFTDSANGNYTLLPCSPAVNTGANTYNTTLTDLAGRPRLFGTIDMGAFEYQRVNTLPDTLYVNGTATNPYSDGSSWAQAFPYLQTALECNCNNVYAKQVWVAAGTYTPSNEQDRGSGFSMHNGQAIYGGFAGEETSLTVRDSTGVTNETILSGEVQGDNEDTNNCYHVLFANTDSTAQLNGFTVTGGYGNGGQNIAATSGAGILTINSSTLFANLRIKNNHASYEGGGFANFGGSPHLVNVVFKNNSCSTGGNVVNDGFDFDGIYPSYSSAVNPVFTNDSFINGLSSFAGGGICNLTANAVFENVIFLNNSAGNYGGGLMGDNSTCTLTHARFIDNLVYDTAGGSRGGGVYMDAIDGSYLVMNDVLFVNNKATLGGGLFLQLASTQSVLNNITFCGNKTYITNGAGNAIYDFGSAISLWNSIIDSASNGLAQIDGNQNDVSVRNTLFIGGFPPAAVDGGANLTHQNPLFIDTANGNFGLMACSPAIDMGNNSLLNLAITTDLAGNPRIYNSIVDMGAYEYQGTAFQQPVITVTGNTLSTTTYASYQWYLDGTLIPGATNASYVYTENGTYMVSVHDGGCDSGSATIVIQNASVNNTSGTLVSVDIYPNPATTMVTIKSTTQPINQIAIINLLGQTVYSNEYNADRVNVDIAGLPTGIYFVRINNSIVRKLIKE